MEEALAYGWVDSRPRSVDDQRSQRLVTPRKPTSKWSKVNKQRVKGLIASGAMTPAGLAAVKLAKRTGTWTALDEVEELREPTELRAALDAAPRARRHWDAVPALDQTRDSRVDRERQDIPRPAKSASPRQPPRRDKNIRANQWRQPKRAIAPGHPDA